ncbi:hypothetical protein EGW74_00405 [Enterococcus casseliflavus]|uniref:Uncharacterized protein n=1 Tax=Enterococcus casseliflavus TaxID=37734 RepID=A0A415ENR5_ENTCA|nr:hypothetical protein D8N35_03635 [Enterococcus casseliflavus]EEV29315.1 predicted protein [Enterococcus casseliflavus EC30]EEV36142.1 predicted protein [Enterococcus casseliflavus EC10]MRI71595.1 hypothetical protein [Enterococcus casseliflavus]RHK04551.1 hypothetical protein DW084_15915 [Enterococcus casseliflavus]
MFSSSNFFDILIIRNRFHRKYSTFFRFIARFPENKTFTNLLCCFFCLSLTIERRSDCVIFSIRKDGENHVPTAAC